MSKIETQEAIQSYLKRPFIELTDKERSVVSDLILSLLTVEPDISLMDLAEFANSKIGETLSGRDELKATAFRHQDGNSFLVEALTEWSERNSRRTAVDGVV